MASIMACTYSATLQWGSDAGNRPTVADRVFLFFCFLLTVAIAAALSSSGDCKPGSMHPFDYAQLSRLRL